MAGLSNSTKKIYVQTLGAAFVKRSIKENPEAIKRVNKVGNEVYELHYDTLEGSIIDIDVKTTEVEVGNRMIKTERLEIEMLCGEEVIILNLVANSGHAFNFYKRMEKINYMEPVTLQMWAYDNPFMAVMQGGKLVDSKYQKEDIPEWKKVEVNGETVWDKTDTMKFFRPKVREVKEQIALYGNTAKKPEPVEVQENDADNDLPF